MLNQPLKGVKVVDFTLFVAGPACAKMLADWGADVIKVEPLNGEPFRKTGLGQGIPCDDDFNPCWNYLNSNKKGIAIDLKNPDGMELMLKLLKDADVFVTNYRTGALDRLGLGYEDLSKLNPGLVWAQINGYGDLGPDKDNPGFDTIAFWGRSGAMLDQVERETPPIIPLIGFGDCTAGSNLCAGIAAALYQKAKTGKGEKVNVALLAAATWNIGTAFIEQQFGGKYNKTRTAPNMPFINSYKCKDGEWIFISVLEHDRYYNALCKAFGQEQLVDNPLYCTTPEAKKRSGEVVAIFDKVFMNYTFKEVSDVLKSLDIAHEKIRHAAGLLTDPQAIENKFIAEVTHANGKKTLAPMTPVKFGNVEINQTLDAPVIGEHTAEILKELNYSDEKIKALMDNKAVIQKTRVNA